MDNVIEENLIFGADVLNWIVFIEIPVFIGLIVYVFKSVQDLKKMFESNEDEINRLYNNMSDKLSNYKLEVSHRYVSMSYLRDIEKRLTNHLIRIEEKLSNR